MLPGQWVPSFREEPQCPGLRLEQDRAGQSIRTELRAGHQCPAVRPSEAGPEGRPRGALQAHLCLLLASAAVFLIIINFCF